MRRGFGVGVMILSIALAIAVGIGAYHWGYNQGLDANGSVEVVRYVGYGAGGFFPFGFLLFPLFFFGLIFLIRGAFWRRWNGHGHHGPMGPGGGPEPRRQAFEDWHRRQHEPGTGEGGSAGGEPATA